MNNEDINNEENMREIKPFKKRPRKNNTKPKTKENVLKSINSHYQRNRHSILEYKAIYYLKKNYKRIYFKKLRLLGMNLFDSQRIIKKAMYANKMVLDLDGETIDNIDDFINKYTFNTLYKYIESDFELLDDDILILKIHKHYFIESQNDKEDEEEKEENLEIEVDEVL